ncbi:hypothetical protein N2152v2_009180 [Parachlorella kessleri]
METLSAKRQRLALPTGFRRAGHHGPQQAEQGGQQRQQPGQHRDLCRPGGGHGTGSGGRRKRQRRQAREGREEDTATSGPSQGRSAGAAALPPACQEGLCEYDVSLYIRWYSAEGASRVSRLPLDPIASVDDLKGLFRRLIQGAFPGALPDYLTSPDFYKFAPAEDFVSLPGRDTQRTHFRLVVTLGGWEHGVVDRELSFGGGGGGRDSAPRDLLVTMAEFESDTFELDGQECVMNLVSYPTICVRRDFLDAAVRNLLRGMAAPAGPAAAVPALGVPRLHPPGSFVTP